MRKIVGSLDLCASSTEGSAIWQDGIASRASDIDRATGPVYGFSPATGAGRCSYGRRGWGLYNVGRQHEGFAAKSPRGSAFWKGRPLCLRSVASEGRRFN